VLALTSAQSQVPTGAAVKLQLELRNVGARPLWLNRKLSFNAADEDAAYREVWLEVLGPDGGELPFLCRVNARPADASDDDVLAPGQSLRRDIDVSSCFLMRQPGRYRVTAFYHDGTEKPPRPPSGAARLRERLPSAPVEIEVLPPP
jgi:hypothetical protein